MKVRDIIKEVQSQGWVMDKRTGTNHRKFTHPVLKGYVIVSGNPGDDLPTGTLAGIRRQAKGTP